jgi:hypothetical protein
MAMTEQHAILRPALWARVAGALYVGTIVTGVFSQYFVRTAIVVRGDAAATAHNLLASEPLFRLGIVSEFFGVLCYVAVTFVLYELLAPVSRRFSLLAVFFSLVGCAVGVVNLLNDLAPLVLLSGAPYLSVFTTGQVQALALTFLRFGGQLNNAGLLCFAFYCMLIGGLILRATFLPRLVGVLMAVAGLSWLISGLAVILSPAVGAALAPLAFVGIAGEASLTLWLLVMGVNAAKWRQMAVG